MLEDFTLLVKNLNTGSERTITVKSKGKLKLMVLVSFLICSIQVQALDFEKEIAEQEIVAQSLQQDLSDKNKSLKITEEDPKKQDFQVVLVPKVRRN